MSLAQSEPKVRTQKCALHNVCIRLFDCMFTGMLQLRMYTTIVYMYGTPRDAGIALLPRSECYKYISGV